VVVAGGLRATAKSATRSANDLRHGKKGVPTQWPTSAKAIEGADTPQHELHGGPLCPAAGRYARQPLRAQKSIHPTMVIEAIEKGGSPTPRPSSPAFTKGADQRGRLVRDHQGRVRAKEIEDKARRRKEKAEEEKKKQRMRETKAEEETTQDEREQVATRARRITAASEKTGSHRRAREANEQRPWPRKRWRN